MGCWHSIVCSQKLTNRQKNWNFQDTVNRNWIKKAMILYKTTTQPQKMWGPSWVIMRMQFKCKNCPNKSCQHGLRHCGVLTLCLKKTDKKKKTKNVNEVLFWCLFVFLLNIIIQQDDMSSHISQPQYFLFSTVWTLDTSVVQVHHSF